LNDIVGIKDSKLIAGGNGFYKECHSLTFKMLPWKRFGTLSAEVRNSDGNLTVSNLSLDMTELLYPGAQVGRVPSSLVMMI
jgi:hypothetical protein